MGQRQPALTVSILTEQEAATRKALLHASIDRDIPVRELVWQILNAWAEAQKGESHE